MRKKSSRYIQWMLFAALLWAQQASAILTIEITEGANAGMPVAVVPFHWQGAKPLPQDVSGIISADLSRSGQLSPIDPKKFISKPYQDKDVDFKEWRLLKADALVIGSISQTPKGLYSIQFRLYDVFKQQQMAGYQYEVPGAKLRQAAHQISNKIYEKLTGEPGVFLTRIAYVTLEKHGKKRLFKLQVADADGYNASTIVRSPEPLMSPAWSPRGDRLAYVSFEAKRSEIYVQDLATGKRTRLAAFPGINSAPAWSPDGTHIALTLSRSGNAEIYSYDIAKRKLLRLTHNLAIDTEPTWSPDGKTIMFTSDRSGSPQIYRINSSGGTPSRVTFEGNYNARAEFSPDGQSITLVSRANGQFHIGVVDLKTGNLRILTDTPLDESPSFAPNGRMIIYATRRHGKGVLASVSSDGRVHQVFTLEGGDVREPAWAPF
jgi:TolB protein